LLGAIARDFNIAIGINRVCDEIGILNVTKYNLKKHILCPERLTSSDLYKRST